LCVVQKFVIYFGQAWVNISIYTFVASTSFEILIFAVWNCFYQTFQKCIMFEKCFTPLYPYFYGSG
jgi:hypothetical protein